jgi:MoaA/NifB/PqqE/SkfB family radical SAM enzyme
MSVDLAKSVIDQLKKMRFDGSLITSLMGEPLMHPRFAEILQYSIESGIKTNVITNFLLVPEKITIEKLLNAGIEILCLSYQTPNETTFKTRRVKTGFDEYSNKLGDILFFAKNNKIKTRRIEIHILQSIYNYLNVKIVDDYDLIKDAIIKLHDILHPNDYIPVNKNYDKRTIFKSINNFKRGNQYKDTYEIKIESNIYVVLKRANTWANRLIPEGCTVAPRKKGKCSFFHNSLGVLWNGDCTICCQDFNGSISIGNAVSSAIEDIIKSEALLTMREKEKMNQISNKYCQICKGTIKRNGRKFSIVKDHGPINKGFQIASRIKGKLAN